MSISLILAIIAVSPWLLTFFHAFFNYKPKEKEMRRHLLLAFGSISLGLFFGIPGHLSGNPFFFKFLDFFTVFGVFWFFYFLLDFILHSRRKFLTKICQAHLFLTWLIILFTPPEIIYQETGIIYVRSAAAGLAVLLFSFCWWGLITYWFFKAARTLKEEKEKRSFQWMGLAGLFALLAFFLAMSKTFFPQVTLLFHLGAISSTGLSGIIFYLGARFPFSLQVMEEKGQLLKLREEYRKVEEIYQTVFENTGTAIVFLEEDTTISLANTEFEKLSGYTREEIEGKKSWTEFVVKEDLERMKRYHYARRIEPTVAPRNYEFRFLDKNGNIKHIFLTVNIISGTKKSIASLIDITERKKAEESAEEEKNKFQATLESIGEGVYAVDPQGRIIFFNKKAEEITGFKQDEVVGKQCSRVFKIKDKRGKDVCQFLCPVFDSTRKKDSFSSDQLEIVNKQGRAVPITSVVTPVKDPEGKTRGFVIAFRDITREREIDRMKSEFISIASHQLRAPLSGIKWFLELVLREDSRLSPTQRRYINRIDESNIKMITLVNDLLNVSRIEEGRIETRPEEIQIEKIIEEILREFQGEIKRKKISLEFKKPGKLLPKLFFDPKQINQIIQNLVENAVNYTEKGKIKILVEKKDNSLLFEIFDTGLGIPKEQQNRVFEKFFRGDNVIQTSTGTGLGLFVCKILIEQNGGKIWFESEEGKGSKFWFNLPLKT